MTHIINHEHSFSQSTLTFILFTASAEAHLDLSQVKLKLLNEDNATVQVRDDYLG